MFLERRYPNKKCKFKINYVCCILYVANVHYLSDQMLKVALYLVTAADEYYPTIGKILRMMAALSRERP